MPDAPADRPLPETARLLSIIARLRGPGGCPWDQAQTLASLRPYLIEECYELLDAVDDGEPAAHREELGDVLLQVVLHAQIRSESGDFDFESVARVLAEKMIRRHPHVFGDVRVADAGEVVRNWDAIKAKEKPAGADSIVDGIPRELPALQRAQRLQARAAREGFDWPHVSGVWAKVEEEIGETRDAIAAGDAARVEAELGDLLFTVVNLCRFQKVNAEQALRGANRRFARRLRQIEKLLAQDGKRMADVTPDELNRHWDAAKAEE